jgi:hypothetical protein
VVGVQRRSYKSFNVSPGASITRTAMSLAGLVPFSHLRLSAIVSRGILSSAKFDLDELRSRAGRCRGRRAVADAPVERLAAAKASTTTGRAQPSPAPSPAELRVDETRARRGTRLVSFDHNVGRAGTVRGPTYCVAPEPEDLLHRKRLARKGWPVEFIEANDTPSCEAV